MSDWYMGELAAQDGYMPPDMPPDEERAPLRIEVRPPTAEAAQPELPPMAPLQPTGGLLPKQVPGSFSPAAMPTEERPSAFMRAMPKVYDPLQKQQQEVANLAYSLTPPGAVSDIVEAYQNKDPAGLLLGVAGGVPGAGTAAKLAAPAVKAALRHPTAVMGGLAALGTAASSDPAEASFLKAPSGKLLEKAKKLLSEGIGVQGIWDQTGLFQGKDGIWRYEVPDLGSKWLTDPRKLVGEKNLQLGDVFRHDKLFPQAPWLPETKLTVTREHPDIGGGFLRRDPAQGRPQNEIEVNVDYAHDTPHSVIMHEGTHVTQFEQALNAGTNINTKPLSKPAQSIYEQIKSDFMNPPTAKEAKAQGIIKPGYPYKQFMKEYEMVKNADPDKRDAYFRRLAADKAYTRSAGETEAGNVQFRANKEQDYLDTMPPPSTEGVPREQQIVTYNEQPQQPRLPGMLMGGLAEQPQLAIKAPTGFAPPSVVRKQASPEAINKAAVESQKQGYTQPELRELYDNLGLTGRSPVALAKPSLDAIQSKEAVKNAIAMKLADRAMLDTLTPEQRKLYGTKNKLPAGMELPSTEAARPALEAFAPVKKEVLKAEKEFDANVERGIKPSLFDLSAATLKQTPNVPQFNLPRVAPKITERIEGVTKGGGGVRRLERAADAAPESNWGWYNLMQARDLFHAIHGKQKGEQAFSVWLDGVAGTSMVNPIDNNIRSSTWYLQQILQGKPMPEVLHIADPRTGKMVKTMAGGPPPGYGAKSQIQHADRVLEYLTNRYDPVSNPKPISYRSNLSGNWMPRTVDTHDIRNMVGMPGALKSFGAEDSALLPGEYSYLEGIGQRASTRAGTAQAPQQAATWVGGGDYTGLKSYPAPLMEVLNRRAHVTAKVYGITPMQALQDAFSGVRPLLSLGGAAVIGTGAAKMGGVAEQGG